MFADEGSISALEISHKWRASQRGMLSRRFFRGLRNVCNVLSSAPLLVAALRR
jgi:hypothetical protein